MASLKEIKGRIASVRTTLKTTSAMKMVASAKLHKAQGAIGNMLPYEKNLHDILEHLLSACAAKKSTVSNSAFMADRDVQKVIIVAFSSNSSLCGGFNANAIRETTSVINEYRASGIPSENIIVYSVGRKMAEAMKKLGYPTPEDLNAMSGHPDYDKANALAKKLMEQFSSLEVDKVELVYNHFKSTSSQPTMRETYLPLNLQSGSESDASSDYIIEPTPEEVIEELLPKVLSLKIFTTLLDTNAAEHAARTVAMQTATDNGNELLEDLTLQYNKSRQSKITSEILDLIGGSLQ
ncbi:MAG: F0F1 ATP synthase subunit gamma [Bacteroidales bacterium]|nr:F0F1 ATP synthase subunit gamma [Bacteroidales bacterium]